MTPSCFYCGGEATHQFTFRTENGKQVKPGNWCCKTRLSSCPGMKARNSKRNSERGADGLTKRERTSLARYGVTHAMKLEENKKYGSENSFSGVKFKQTMLSRYGVTNRSQLPGVGAHISNTLTSRDQDWWGARADKQRRTAEANGTWIPESEISNLETYRHRVQYRTELNYTSFKDIINPESVIRSRYGNYHIDHIYSVKDAFLNDVPIEVVSHPCNLRMISESDNKRKNGKSDITLEELYRRFDEATNK